MYNDIWKEHPSTEEGKYLARLLLWLQIGIKMVNKHLKKIIYSKSYHHFLAENVKLNYREDPSLNPLWTCTVF